MKPSSVNIDNQAEVRQNLQDDLSKQKSEKSSFKVGDTVRISKWKGRFEKGYENNWSTEIFTVHKIIPRIPTIYKLRDFHNIVIEGTFYEKEMQKIVDSGYYPVEKLPSPTILEGKWEVGLAEIIYPYTWYNVNEKNNIFGFDLGEGELITRKIPRGSYETVPDILKAVVIPSHEGFHPHVVERVEESSFVADPQAAFPVFYVYSDIVQPIVVGHAEAPLLRVVRISRKDGDVVNAHYDRPHYVHVIRQSFQAIEIELRLNSGALVPFERGKVIVVLHSNATNPINTRIFQCNIHLQSGKKKSSITREPYVCCTEKFEEHCTNHIGYGIPYYEGVSFQKGCGIGGIFRRLFRAALPFLVKSGKALGKETLTTGTIVVNDVLF
ncbi:hypothetical protein AVEN_37752-1 [Araneus ventricosus]|uniref:Uncharacterized protein n=1 Tax=Araneus ventricosus TaxID=182803 RepID=A0A4Y2BTN8_ARAVE|nr:hypothetical protein AVEN_37752-1 [Araneus ventricosus]